MKKILLIAAWLLTFICPAHADFQAGLAAYQAHDYAEAMKQWRPLAEAGDAAAQNKVALLYAEGLGVKQDYATALIWTRKAAGQGDDLALYHLGKHYAKGWAVPQDFKEAVVWYRQAAEKGNVYAQVDLGSILANGTSGTQDYCEAMQWYLKAAEKGQQVAQFNLGTMYDLGQSVPVDMALAKQWFRKSAFKGYAPAQYRLSEIYAEGKGGIADPARASFWSRVAAERGLLPAQLDTARRYAYGGDGAPLDAGKAARWYSEAARQGSAEARQWLNEWDGTTIVIGGSAYEKHLEQLKDVIAWMDNQRLSAICSELGVLIETEQADGILAALNGKLDALGLSRSDRKFAWGIAAEHAEKRGDLEKIPEQQQSGYCAKAKNDAIGYYPALFPREKSNP